MSMIRLIALLLGLVLIFGGLSAARAEEDAAVPAMGMSMEEYYGEDESRAVPDPTVAPTPLAPYAPENLEKTVFDTDDRVTISNPAAYPYSAIGNMYVHKSCGCNTQCTCFMVGPSGVMTASHCVVCSTHGGLADQIEIYFGYRSEKNYLYHYTGGTRYWYGTSFKRADGTYSFGDFSKWDYAYIKLNERVGDYTGWLGTYEADTSEIYSHVYEVAGYRDGLLKTNWGGMEKQSGSSMEYQYRHKADTEPGNSGGPVFADNYAMGIISSHSDSYNYVRMITWDLLSEMTDNGIFD